MPILSILLLGAADAASAGSAGPDPHNAIPAEIIVSAPLQRERFLAPTAIGVLSGETLAREIRPSIGETLARQPGVSSTWFGPGASRPILRGMQAERVRVLTDGIGSFDVSNTSVDHAVAINPLLAERIEVIRGPASLLFGSSAIGGVVNVLDRRIPRQLPAEDIHIEASGTLASAAEERGGGAAVDVPVSGTGLVFHADGSYMKTGDLRVGGHIFAKPLRDAAAAEGGAVAEAAAATGRMPNTGSRTWDAASGLSWFGNSGSYGFSVSHLESNYGIPDTLAFGGAEAENGVRLDMRQTRVDARAEVGLSGWFRQVKFRFGWADYRHDEIDVDGSIGTTFLNKGLEARLELVQERRGVWEGASGVQYLARDFDALGDEAYIPRNHTEQAGLFTLQQFDLGPLRAEVGGRFEHSSITAPTVGFARNFDAVSVSGGVSAPLAPGLRIAVNVAHSERAPSAEELLSNGAHIATRSFEIGSRTLGLEKSLGGEVVLRGRGPGWHFELSGFYTRFSDFIWFGRTGAEEDGLSVYAAGQRDARFRGFEAEGALDVARIGATRIGLTALSDYVRADLDDGGGPVPRIPPMRFIGGIEAESEQLSGRVEVEHGLRQDRTTAFETETRPIRW